MLLVWAERVEGEVGIPLPLTLKRFSNLKFWLLCFASILRDSDTTDRLMGYVAKVRGEVVAGYDSVGSFDVSTLEARVVLRNAGAIWRFRGRRWGSMLD